MQALVTRWAATVGLWMVATCAWAQTGDVSAIVHTLRQQFDRPDAPLAVAPVTVVDAYAVAGWQQAGHGGRALLQKLHGVWTITVCGGDGLRDAQVLQSTGMPADQAQRLAQAVAAAEAPLDAATRQRLASFTGLVPVAGPHGGHAASHATPAGGH